MRGVTAVLAFLSTCGSMSVAGIKAIHYISRNVEMTDSHSSLILYTYAATTDNFINQHNWTFSAALSSFNTLNWPFHAFIKVKASFYTGIMSVGDGSQDYDDYEAANAIENDADKETRSFPTPKFISESSHVLVNEGDTVIKQNIARTMNNWSFIILSLALQVRLPCLVDRLEWFVTMWKRDAAILTVMHQVIDQVTTPVQWSSPQRTLFWKSNLLTNKKKRLEGGF